MADKKFDVRRHYHSVDWKDRLLTGNRIYLVEVGVDMLPHDITDCFTRKELFDVNTIIINNKEEAYPYVDSYTILDRVVDSNNNLILFAQGEYYRL
ncbi:hypothetical protein QT711_03145 [Sporosarcina saromensis]|uniref:Uncharacterized protein n=1 Tax=Sporosarcina saromensis TaxID=359365 RepID=A0ABU4G5I5_9BACL|nr:hypothetical protein [Sporosarcina saromensis]MDW0112166.1 hypothetical protein [Sporosarcina saromensis]